MRHTQKGKKKKRLNARPTAVKAQGELGCWFEKSQFFVFSSKKVGQNWTTSV
jgi:hypothetical protein